MRIFTLILLVCSSVVSCSTGALASDEGAKLFVRRVLPLLNRKCVPCHGDQAEGGLDLRTAKGLELGGDSGTPAILPGNPNHSPLVLAVRREDETWSAMPPKESEKLTPTEVQWLSDWIADGAPWLNDREVAALQAAHAEAWAAEDGAPVKTSGGLSDDWTQRPYREADLWAYRPVRKPEPEVGRQ